MTLRFPRPLQKGDQIGVTCPSSGITEGDLARFRFAIDTLERRGYRVMVGSCIDGAGIVSAPRTQRVREFEDMMCDPSIRAVVPPWGGELALDMVSAIDWERVALAEPTWLVGYSDMTSLLVPYTLTSGVATLHGSNLMETPFEAPEGMLTWLGVAESPSDSTLVQDAPAMYREGFVIYAANPYVTTYECTAPADWVRIDSPEPCEFSGRLIGGCVETIRHLVGSRYGDLRSLEGPHIVYLEVAQDEAFAVCRTLHGMRMAGFFENASGILIGRTAAPDSPGFSQYEAVHDALSELGIPVIADVECGHVSPAMPFVNGAYATVTATRETARVTQRLA